MRTLFFLLSMIFTTSAWSQDVTVRVHDKENSEPIALAYVNVYSRDSILATFQTDENGIVSIKSLPYPVTIEVVSAGHEKTDKLLTQAPINNELLVQLERKFSSLNEVVITGVSQPVKLKDALSVYQIVPREMIQAQGAVTLDEALKNQLNIRIGNDNILGSSIGLQGMSGDKVKILIDGLPVNGREAGNINISQLNMNNVERIEMIQGPMSVVYGTDALGGVINIITRRESKSLAFQAGTYYESVGKYNADASASMQIDKHHAISIGGGRNYFQGWKYLDQPLSYQSDTLNYNRNLFFKPKEVFIGNFGYSYYANSGFKLHFASDFLKENVTNRGLLQVWDPFLGCYAFDEYYRTTRSMNRLTMNGKAGKKGFWQTQAGYSLYYRQREKVMKNMVTLVELPTQGKGDQDTSVFHDVALRSSYNNSISKINYTVGYDINLQNARSTKLNSTTREIQDYAVYASVSIPLLKETFITQLGGRAAYNSSYTAPIIPSINLLFKGSDKVQLRGSYTKGFRAPSLKEMHLSFIDQNHYVIGNTNLLAEYSHHAQVSASYQVYQKQADYLQFIITGFYNDVHNGIVLVPLNPDDSASIEYMYSNVTHQSSAIASAQADGQLGDFHFQAGYSYRHMFAETGSFSAFGAQEATATLQYAWRKAGINFNLFYKYIGTQPFLRTSIDGTAYYNGSQKGYSTFDGSVESKLWEKKIQVIAGVKNILNVTQLRTTGITTSTGTHGGSGTSGGFLPRSFFTSVRLSIGK